MTAGAAFVSVLADLISRNRGASVSLDLGRVLHIDVGILAGRQYRHLQRFQKSHYCQLLGIRQGLELALRGRCFPAVSGDRCIDRIEIAAMAPWSRVARIPELGSEELIAWDREIAVGGLDRRGGLVAIVRLVVVADHVALQVGKGSDGVT